MPSELALVDEVTVSDPLIRLVMSVMQAARPAVGSVRPGALGEHRLDRVGDEAANFLAGQFADVFSETGCIIVQPRNDRIRDRRGLIGQRLAVEVRSAEQELAIDRRVCRRDQLRNRGARRLQGNGDACRILARLERGQVGDQTVAGILEARKAVCDAFIRNSTTALLVLNEAAWAMALVRLIDFAAPSPRDTPISA